MDIENDRRGACDRCRGQKLRCVGAKNPISNSTSRLLRNEIPCERCKRAKVECYYVRPVSRKATGGDINIGERQTATKPAPEKSTTARYQRGLDYSHPNPEFTTETKPQHNSQQFGHHHQPDSVASHMNQLTGMCQGPDSTSTISTMINGWETCLQEDAIGWHDFSPQTSPWNCSNVNTCSDSVSDSMSDHNMIDLPNQDLSTAWNSLQFGFDVFNGQIESSNLNPAKARELISSEQRPDQTRRTSQMSFQNPSSMASSVQDLEKFNEMLLREKSSRDDLSTQQGLEASRGRIGQTLHHTQEFLSILKRIKYSCQNPCINKNHTRSELSFLTEDSKIDDAALIHQARKSIFSDAPLHPEHLFHCTSTFPFSARSLSSSIDTPTPVLEIPTLLSILFCYTYILQLYDVLFMSILDAITRPTPTSTTLPRLSGLSIDGFELDDHNTLKLECLINVSYNLLEKLENIVIGDNGLLSHGKNNLLGDRLFAGFIDALFESHEENIAPGNEKREVRAKRLIREIQVALRVSDL